MGASGGPHGRVKGRLEAGARRRGELRARVGGLEGPDGLRRLSWLDGVNRMTGHGVLPAGSSWTVGLVPNAARRGSVTARTGGGAPTRHWL